MRRAGSPSRGCRSAATSPPAPSPEFPVPESTAPRGTPMSDVADPNPPEIGTAELPDPETEVEAELEQIEENFDASGPLVGILVGSDDDLARMLPAEEYLSEGGIESEVRVLAAAEEGGDY